MQPTDEGKDAAMASTPEASVEPPFREELTTYPEVPEAKKASEPPPPVDSVQQAGLEPSGAVPVAPEPPRIPAEGPDSQPTPSHRGYPPVLDSKRPTFVFLGVVSVLSLFADIGTKVWAEIVLNERGHEGIPIIGENVSIILAYNKGGAWGMGSTFGEIVRKPFFFAVSAFAVVFILSLYSRLHPSQKALKWGLPLVLGGALGNLSDRITRSQVIDFIDYRADWVMSLNSFIHRYYKSWALTDHWPTFNVADVAICIGVILMGVDMFTHRPRSADGSSVPPSGLAPDLPHSAHQGAPPHSAAP